MKELTLEQVNQFGQGHGVIGGSTDLRICGVSVDSREIQHGDLFVALKGENFDGHDFLGDVAQKGASAAMVSSVEMKSRTTTLPTVLVDDTLTGLQNLARGYRKSLGVRTVAVAGSNGKTGTKEMVAAVLSERFSVLKNKGNLNNHIGVPISLLRLDPAHALGVLEVGTNHPGELTPLLQMIEPLAGIITTIGEEHLEYFHNLEGVALEEGTVAEMLPAEGLLVLNADDEWSSSIARRAKCRIAWFGCSEKAAFRASSIRVEASGTTFQITTPKGDGEVTLKLIGRHQVSNALAAAAVGDFFGLSLPQITQGLASVSPTKMRMQQSTTRGGVMIINDAYNANPSSMRAALESMRELVVEGRRFAVLGEMRELGAAAAEAHREIGAHAAHSEIDVLVVVGEGARPIVEGAQAVSSPAFAIKFFETPAEAGAFLRAQAREGDVVLVKASRGAALERVLEGME